MVFFDGYKTLVPQFTFGENNRSGGLKIKPVAVAFHLVQYSTEHRQCKCWPTRQVHCDVRNEYTSYNILQFTKKKKVFNIKIQI